MSKWTRERLGAADTALAVAVSTAITRAHESAAMAQMVSQTDRLDPYGHTLKVRQHECLAQEASQIEGVRLQRPKGANFDLITLSETAVVLYPWRYSGDATQRRNNARMRQSGFRTSLLSGIHGSALGGQLTLEQGAMDEDELEALIAEEAEIIEQLSSFGQVVTIAYGSNPTNGVFDLGWGDAELLDERGRVKWHHWEEVDRGAGEGGSEATVIDVSGGPSGTPNTQPRFDEAELNDDFGITPQHPLHGTPEEQSPTSTPDTGTEGD